MSILDQILPLFLTRVIGGYAICLGLFGPRVTEGSWRKVSLFVIAGLCAAAAFWGAPLWPCLVTGVVALIIERAIVFDLMPLNRVEPMVAFGAWVLLANEWPPSFATFPSAIAAGGSLGAMLLGHSYLTARKLSFKPFQQFTLLLLMVIGLRVLTVVPVLFVENLAMMDWVYLSARAAFGLLLPLVFAWMAVQCAKIESNQSATGILYAMTALVFLGEMTAVYLQTTSGIPA
ncbi:MAG: hypothetical protein ACYTHK_17920 [Planctomycetota bacterium]|jgi:hypothetical protein